MSDSDNKKPGMDLSILLASFIYEVMICLCFFYLHIIQAGTFFVLHFLLSGLLVLAVCVYRIREYAMKDIVFSCLLISFLGPFGALLFIIAYISASMISRDTGDIGLFMEEIKKEQYTQSEKIYNKLMFISSGNNEEVRTEPFEDIITYGTVVEKQTALIKVKRFFQPEFIRILRIASSDEDNTIRVQAASEMSSLKKTALEETMRFESEIVSGKRDEKLFIDYCEFYRDYIKSGFLEYGMIEALTTQFINAYRETVNSAGASIDLKLAFIQLLTYTDKFDEGLAILSSMGGNADELSRQGARQIMSYMELLYLYHRYEDLRTFASICNFTGRDNSITDRDLTNVLNQWRIHA